MADTIHVYSQYMKSLMNKEINWNTDRFALMLAGSSYTPNQSTHQYKASVTGEVTGDGYDAGGQELTNVTLNFDAVNKRYTVSAASVVWENASLTAAYGILYDKTPATDATRPLVLYIALNPIRNPENGNLGFNWNPNGIFRFSIVEP